MSNYIWRQTDLLFTRRRMNIGREYFHGDILDIGCGNGGVLQSLKSDIHYFGVDCDANLIEQLRQRFNNTRFEFVRADLEKEKLPLADTFGTILMIAFIEHLRNPENVLSECFRLLKVDGTLVITTPTTLGDKMLRILVPVLNPLRKTDVERPHYHIYNERDLKSLLEHSGFTIERYRLFEFGVNQLCVAHKR